MKRIVFEVGLFADEASRPGSERTLQAFLHALYVSDVEFIKAHPSTPDIYTPGLVRYQREPIPAEIWKTIPYCIEDGHGDCEDLACWLAAQRNVREGLDARPVFRWRKVGRLSIYHIFVRYPDGRIEDPSKRLGM